MKTTFNFIAAAVLTAIAAGVVAAPMPDRVPHAASGATPADRLADLQAERALLKVQVDIAKQREELAKAKGEAEVAQGAAAPAAKPRAVDALPEPPTLISISGLGGVFTAVVESGGVTQPVKPGDRLPSGWLVRAVSADGLTIAAGNRVMLLRP